MVTDKRQFGFEITLVVAMLSICLKTINNFVNNGLTVSLGCLDLSKAFDRCNNYGLLLKLLEVKMPFHIVNMCRIGSLKYQLK